MPNPNIHYKEINELLKRFDLKVQKVKEGLNKSPMYEFGIEFQKNEIGINKENIESILFALHKNEILIKSTPRVNNKGVVFSVIGINTELISEIKDYYNFDL